MKTQKNPGATGLFRNYSANILGDFKLNQRHCSLGLGEGGSQPPRKRETKTERAYMLLISKPGGVTENDILRACQLSSGRNYPNKLEKEARITLDRIREPNPDGVGSHFRYRITSARDACQALKVVNRLRVARGVPPLVGNQIRHLLRSYPSRLG